MTDLAIGKPRAEHGASCGLAVVLSGGCRIEVHVILMRTRSSGW